MREVLFRGKDNGVLSHQWQYGSADFTNKEFPQIIRNDRFGNKMYIPTDTETVGQFTGLTDKNGKRIWEGDIVRIVSTDYVGFDEIGRVEFKDGCFGVSYFPAWERKYSFGHWHFHRIGQVDKWQDMSASGEMKYTYEIIGNIHDNPELMEVSA